MEVVARTDERWSQSDCARLGPNLQPPAGHGLATGRWLSLPSGALQTLMCSHIARHGLR